jgi:hypothetical protein
MTWLADQQKDRPAEDERAKLLIKREKLVKELEAFKAKGPTSKSVAAQQFFQEDLVKRAQKIVQIDKKLGRL